MKVLPLDGTGKAGAILIVPALHHKYAAELGEMPSLRLIVFCDNSKRQRGASLALKQVVFVK